MGVDRAHRDTHGIGNIAIAQTVDIAQLECLPAFIGQFAYSHIYLTPHLLTLDIDRLIGLGEKMLHTHGID